MHFITKTVEAWTDGYLTERQLFGLFWISLYSICGPTIILLNSHVMNKEGYPYPIAFSSLGVLGAALIGRLMVRLGYWEITKTLTFNEWLTMILPQALASVICMALGNVAYLFLSVAFVQMLKGLTPVYIMLLMTSFGLKAPQSRTIQAVIVIAGGAMVASLGELRFSILGFVVQSLADCLEGMRLIMLQVLMSNSKLSSNETIYYVYPTMSACQFLLVMIFERGAIFSFQAVQVFGRIWYMFAAGLTLGFLINLSGTKVIQYTSGLTFKLIGVVRNNILVIASVTFFGDQTTFTQMLGYVVSVLGFMWYTKLEQEGANQPVRLDLKEAKQMKEATTDDEDVEIGKPRE